MSFICEICGKLSSIKAQKGRKYCGNKKEKGSCAFIANRKYIKNYSIRNKAKIREQGKKWHLEHPNYLRNWRAKNPEKIKKYVITHKLVLADKKSDKI